MKAFINSSVLLIVQCMIFILQFGCKEDLTSPSDPNKYKTALYGTFKGMYVDYYTANYQFTRMEIKSSSFIQLNQEDNSYAFRIYGTVNGNDISFEQNGTFNVGAVTYVPPVPSKWLLGYWKGEISFTPNSTTNRWTLPFEITDVGAANILYVRPRTSIYLSEHDFPNISIFSWFP